MNMGQQTPYGQGSMGIQSQTTRPALSDSVIKWRMDTEDVMKKIELEIASIGNQKLVKRAMTILQCAINKSTMQGNISSEDPGKISLVFANDESEHIGEHYKEYDLAPGNRDIYIDIIASYVFLGLTRPVQDWERRHTVDQGQEKHITTQGIQSVLPLFPGGGSPPPPPQRHGLL